MKDPLVQYKIGVNYWDVDSQLTTISPFSEIYKADKSKKKDESSQTMWALAFFCLPTSRLANSSTIDKISLIDSDISTVKIDWIKVKALVDDYLKFYTTSLERTLYTWKCKLDERNDYLINMKYSSMDDIGEAAKLDKFLAQQAPLVEAYNKLVESIGKEKSQAKTKASAKRSAGEKKLI